LSEQRWHEKDKASQETIAKHTIKARNESNFSSLYKLRDQDGKKRRQWQMLSITLYHAIPIKKLEARQSNTMMADLPKT